MRILLAPFGSEGDVNPFLWLASGLQARGHEVRLLLSPHFGWLADERGLTWISVGTAEDFLRFARHPEIWKSRAGTEYILQSTMGLFEVMRAAYHRAGPPFDLVITSVLGMAISYLAEAQRTPRVLLHLQPLCMRSLYDTPLYLNGMEWANAAPRWVKRAFFGLVDLQLGRHVRAPVNAFRDSLGLPPIGNLNEDVLMAGDRVGLLFPDWFAAPQPDWPSNVRQFGFPLARSESSGLDPALEAFLGAGEPPIVWSHGSANFAVQGFQAIALAASRQLGERCLLVSPDPPAEPLPPDAFHIRHAKFAALFPRCRLAVNHGGIGTVSKTLAAGIPQLVVPLAHDQPDNGRRITQLGLGDSIPFAQLTADRAVARIRALLNSSEVGGRCREIQARLAASDPLPDLCEWLESRHVLIPP